MMGNVIAVGVGGFVGATLRYLTGEWFQTESVFPLGTLVVNLLGCLFIGWFFTITTTKWNISPNLRLALGTGFVGSFTTFSAFSVETLNLIMNHHYFLVIVYILLSVFGGIGLTLLGCRLGGESK